MKWLNVPTAEKQRGDEVRLKQNLDTDLVVQRRNPGAALAEHENETKKTADTRNALGTVSQIAGQDMIVLVVMIKH